jgi:hypothetical protein
LQNHSFCVVDISFVNPVGMDGLIWDMVICAFAQFVDKMLENNKHKWHVQ